MGWSDAAAGTVAHVSRHQAGVKTAVSQRVSERTAPQEDDLAVTVAAAQQGDEVAFATLYTAIQPGLLWYLRALVGDNDADDVASEAWLHIARDLRGLRDASGFRGWAAAIARHRAMDHLRRRKRQPVASVPVETLVDLPAGQSDSCDEAMTSVSTDAAVALIASLPREQAEAVLLRVVVGLDTETSARILDKRPGAVRVAAHRGLRRLASVLAARNLVTNPSSESKS